MRAKSWARVLCLVAFVGCSAEDGGESSAESPVETSSSEVVRCQQYVTTLSDHVQAGRVKEQQTPFLFWQVWTYTVAGSNESLGVNLNKSQVYTLYPRTGGGFTTNAALCLTADCGNGVVEGTEECDPAATQPTCHDFEDGYLAGNMRCDAQCRWDVTECKRTVCGDATVSPPEQCEGVGPTGFTCNEYLPVRYAGGPLRCGADCQYDTSQCTLRCGNGVLDEGEECDGTLLASPYTGKTCSDYNFRETAFPFGNEVRAAPGPLPCTPICTVATSQCNPVPGCYWKILNRTTAVPFCY